uniref:Tyrosine-protein phosphatase domain-containing protein n=1 Tax=Steinernema glaseri TaxID=37863 RepID=A0A1I8AKH3_9BILA
MFNLAFTRKEYCIEYLIISYQLSSSSLPQGRRFLPDLEGCRSEELSSEEQQTSRAPSLSLISMTTSRPFVVARAMSGESQMLLAGGSSSSIQSSGLTLEKIHVGGVIKSTEPIVYQPPRSSTPNTPMPHSQPRPLNRSLTGPTLNSPPTVPAVNRRFEVFRNGRAASSQRSASAHPPVTSSRPKVGPIRVLSLAHSIPESEEENSPNNSAKKRSRSASSIEACRPESPRQLLAFMFSGAQAFCNESEWTCGNAVHRFLNLTGTPCSVSAKCKCPKGARHQKQELVLNVDQYTTPQQIVNFFPIVNKFIGRARSAASNILVAHHSDHLGYCIAFIVQYIIVHHDIELPRALVHCQALQNFEIPKNALDALRIWQEQKNATPEPKPSAHRSDDFKWVQVTRPVKLAWC